MQRTRAARPSEADEIPQLAEITRADPPRPDATPFHAAEDLSDSVTLVETPFPENEHAAVTVVPNLATRAQTLRRPGRGGKERTPLPRLSRLLGER